MKPYTLPALLWLCAVAGLLMTLLGDGALETLGLGLLIVPLLIVTRYSFARS